MKHLVVGGLAALAIGLAGAPMAGADANDREFIKATDKVIMRYDGSDDGHWSDIRSSCSTQDRHRPRGVRHAG